MLYAHSQTNDCVYCSLHCGEAANSGYFILKESTAPHAVFTCVLKKSSGTKNQVFNA